MNGKNTPFKKRTIADKEIITAIVCCYGDQWINSLLFPYALPRFFEEPDSSFSSSSYRIKPHWCRMAYPVLLGPLVHVINDEQKTNPKDISLALYNESI